MHKHYLEDSHWNMFGKDIHFPWPRKKCCQENKRTVGRVTWEPKDHLFTDETVLSYCKKDIVQKYLGLGLSFRKNRIWCLILGSVNARRCLVLLTISYIFWCMAWKNEKPNCTQVLYSLGKVILNGAFSKVTPFLCYYCTNIHNNDTEGS